MSASVLISPFFQRPGAGTEYTGDYRNVFLDGKVDYFPGGGVIDGPKSRNPFGSYIYLLQAGLLMGKVTATGQYAPSVIGVTQAAYTSGGTSLTLTAAAATELVRRVGSTGNITVTGSPTASGTVASTTVAYSAVNTTTGVVTIADIGANRVAGSFVCDTDGSQTPVTVIPDGLGVNIEDYTTAVDVNFPKIPIRGTIDVTQLLPWPSNTNTSLQAYVKTSLNTTGRFVFSNDF